MNANQDVQLALIVSQQTSMLTSLVEIKTLQATTNGRVTTLERENIKALAREEERLRISEALEAERTRALTAAINSKGNRLLWTIISALGTALAGVGVLLVKMVIR